MSITDIIKSLNTAEESDNLFIVAAAINLYNESHRRIRGQVLYGPDNVKALLGIIEHLLAAQAQSQIEFAPKRNRKLTEDEEARLLKAVEATTTEAQVMQ